MGREEAAGIALQGEQLVAVAVAPEAPAPTVTTVPLRAPKGREEEFARKRAAEEALLLEYEVSGSARAAFAVQKKMKVGTIDGIFSRVRKRRVEDIAMRC